MSTSERLSRARALWAVLAKADADPATTAVQRERIRREIHALEGGS